MIFFPPSSSWHQMLLKHFNVALVDCLFLAFPCFKYALRGMWNFEKKIEKCIANEEEWTSNSVSHCKVTVAAWRRENTRDIVAALQRSGKIGGKWKQFSAEIFWSGPITSQFYSIFQCVTTRSTEMTMSGLVLSWRMAFFHLRRSGGSHIPWKYRAQFVKKKKTLLRC